MISHQGGNLTSGNVDFTDAQQILSWRVQFVLT